MGRHRQIAWLVAFCLLLAQQAGFAHAYSHHIGSPGNVVAEIDGMDRDQADGSLFHPCPECLAFAACHSFLCAADALPGGTAAPPGVTLRGATLSTSMRRGGCRTRAPPACS